ncbi:MAG: oligosaccharide flippase family protein [Sulfurovum sp.]|nr:oligosaccharide flippase family protein [Sulfurovum sp.]
MLKRLKAKLNGDIHLKEILTGSAVTFVLKMSGMLLGYVVLLIISRQYGAEGIGVYNLTLIVMTFVAMMSTMGMNVSILRYVGQFNKSCEEYKLKLLYRYAVELVVPFSLLLAVGLYFFAGVIADNVFHNPVYKPALEYAAIIVPFMALQDISIEFIRGLKQLKVSEFLRSVNRPVINITLLLIIGLFIVDELLPLYTLGLGIIISALFAVFFIVKKLQKIVPESKIEFSKKELITTSFPMMIISVASFVMGNISLFMLEAFSTTKEVGIFSVALQIATLISLVLVVVNTISAPKFSELYWSKKSHELQKVISHATRLIFFSSLFMSIFIVIFSKSILSMFGDEFIIGSTALIYLMFGQLINSATGSVGILLNMTGHQKELQVIILITVIITIVLNIVFVPIYGMNGAAVITMLGTIILNVASAIFAKRKLMLTTYYLPIFTKELK